MKRFFHLFHRSAADRQLADEMRDHLAERIDDLVDAGMSREAATAEARRRFGNTTSLVEQSRDEWAFPRMENLVADLRYAARTLVKNPLFAAVVVLPLALGIGANTAIFTVVEAALIRSLPYENPDRLVHLFEIDLKTEPTPHEASYPDFVEWSTATKSFTDVAGYSQGGSLTLGGGVSQPEQASAGFVTTNFFPVLGVQPIVGRGFVPAEGQPGGASVALLSESLWRRRFHADRNILGTKVYVNLQPVEVVGVLPASYHFAPLGAVDLWFVARPSKAQRERGYWHWLQAIARLRPTATIHQADTELAAVSKRIAQRDPDHHGQASIRVIPLRDVIVGDVRPVLLVLLGTIGLVLLIACANVANLLLARSAARQKELAVRASMGASRGRLIQQLLTESLLLATLGGVLGLGVARAGVSALIGAIPNTVLDSLPFLRGLSLNWPMLGFTFAISLVTGVLFGLAPALRLSRSDWQDTLKQGRGTSAGTHHQRARRALLVFEVAISLVLLAGAGLMMKSTVRLLNTNPGFATDHLVTAQVALPGLRYTKNEDILSFYARLMPAVQSIPGVRRAATVSVLPLTGGANTGTMRIDALGANSPVFNVSVRTISANYFETLGIPFVAGRLFDDRDKSGATKVIIVNQKLAREAFPTENPVGKIVSFPWSGGPLEIAGVVGDENTVTLDSPVRAAVYFPVLQGPSNYDNLVVRTAVAPDSIAGALRAQVRAIDPDVSLFAISTMDDLIASSQAAFLRRYPAFLIGIFAAIALVMATIGTYGLVAYAVAQRRQEIGIRIALGAQRGDIFRLVIGQGMVLVAIGVAIGLAGAAMVTRVLGNLLFGVKPIDPATFGSVAAILLAAALTASYFPARRAVRIPPGEVLGSE